LSKEHGYGSIPIDTFLVGWTSINPSYLGFTRYQGFDPSPHIFVIWGKIFCGDGSIWKTRISSWIWTKIGPAWIVGRSFFWDVTRPGWHRPIKMIGQNKETGQRCFLVFAGAWRFRLTTRQDGKVLRAFDLPSGKPT
jgi:hypothetical protein